MKTKTFTGKDERDLNKQKWEWHSTYPNAVVKKIYPIETLSPDLTRPAGRFAKIGPAQALVSMRIDYEEVVAPN
jgi:hypothetical protein